MSKTKTQILNYTVHIEPSLDGGFDVSVPALPGCLTQGDTYEEAISMARECIQGFIEALRKQGLPVPKEHVSLVQRLKLVLPIALPA